MTTVVLCGMPSEKDILSKAFPGTLILSGTDKLNLPRLIPDTCTRIISMGLCGGLSPDLSVPDVALATAVIDHAGAGMPTDPDWNEAAIKAASKAGITLHLVPYYSSGLFDEADTVDQRAAMFKRYGTHAIDDESRFVVAEAVRRKVPFNVVRPLSDDYRDTLPLMARGKIMNSDGSANLAYLFAALGQDQGEGAESVFTVAANYRRSLEVLEALAKALAGVITQ